MTNEQQHSYDILQAKCDNIKVNKLLMSSNTILTLLRTLASDNILRDILEQSNRDIDYTEEYHNACNYLPSGNVFSLPSNPKRIISLVTGILYEFDKETLSPSKFLKDFFPAANTTESFDIFCDEVLSAYVRAFKDVMEGRFVDDVKVEENIILEEEKSYDLVNDFVKEQVSPYLILVIKTLFDDQNVPQKQKDDAIAIIRGLSYALESFNSKIVSTIWLGFKYCVASISSIKSYVASIEETFKNFEILEVEPTA